MRLATYRAAGRVDQGLPFAREVALARRLCAERGMAIGSDGVQLLGGHGYVKEHPVERWYRDLRAAGADGGSAARLMINLEIPKKFERPDRPGPPGGGRGVPARTRASTTPPSTSTRRSSTCSPR